MYTITDNPMFGILLTLLAFEIGSSINKKMKLPIFNPVLIATLLIIILLIKFNIPVNIYNNGADFISFFLSPATVALAVPLYRQTAILKSNAIPIVSGIFVGCITSLISTIFLSKILGLNYSIGLSIIPKSVTTPIGVELSKQIGGIPPLTLVTIIIAGNIGYMAAPLICRIFGIKNKVAIGVSIGTSSHALGTTKAIQLGELEGAMSGLSIGLAGIFTVILAPIVIYILF